MSATPIFRLNGASRLVRYAIAYGTSSILLKGVGFLLFLWIARSLTVDEFAIFGLLYALQAGIATFAVAGISESVIGLMKDRESTVARRALFAAANSVFMVMAITSVGVILFALLLFGGSMSSSIVALLSAITAGVLIGLATLQAEFHRVEEDHRNSLKFSFAVPFVGQIGGLLGILYVSSASVYFAGSATGLFAAAVYFAFRKIGFYVFVSRVHEALPILRRLGPFFALAVIGWLSGYGNNFSVNYFFEPSAVARFTFVFTLASIMQLVATSLNQVWGPRFYRLVREAGGAEIEHDNRRFFRWQAILMGGIGGAFIAIFPVATGLIGGNVLSYGSIELELLLLFSAYVVFSPWWHCQNYFLVHGKGPDLVKIVLKTSTLGFPAWFGLMFLLGEIGIYIGFLVHLAMRMVGVVFVARGRWNIRPAWEGIALGLLLLVLGFLVSRNFTLHNLG